MTVRRVDNIEYLLDNLKFYVENFDELSMLFMVFYANKTRHSYASVSKYINEKAI